jgi:hypothetical protein
MDGGVSFWAQTKLLFVKNWRTKIRTEPKKLLEVGTEIKLVRCPFCLHVKEF